MKKIFSILLVLIITCSNLIAQQTDNSVNTTISVFPYQQHNQIDGALTTMSGWGKIEWKKLCSYLDQAQQSQDSLKLKATYALNAFVNKASLNTIQKASVIKLLGKQLKKAKTEYAKIFITTQLALLTDVAIVDARNNSLPAVPIYIAAKASNLNGVQQLLQLQDEMELAKNPIQQKRILAKVAHIPGYSSFAFVSKYLTNEAINNDAASIITRLALEDASIKGANVRAALEIALPLIKGVDSAILVNKLKAHLKKLPYDNGFVSLFNGKDLTGWKGLVGNPVYRSRQSDSAMQALQVKADEKIKNDWVVKDGILVFTGHGDNLCTQKKYGDFEMYVDWKITEQGDAGIYLRGSPQVQIWDTSRHEVGAQVGSGGLYNNQKNKSTPLVVADNKIGEWNNFHIIMKGNKVTVYLNGILVTDNIILENYWDRALPIFEKEQIELQAHGTYVAYRNIYIKEIPSNQPVQISEIEKKEGFVSLFDGLNLDQWRGNKTGYIVADGTVVVNPEDGNGGNLYTNNEYANFVYRFEFQLTPGANNGIGIHAPPAGDAAYVGMEIQVLDNEAPIYKDLHVYQYHGSVYGVIPAKRGYLLPTGEWNQEEIMINGSKIKVTLNGTVITEGDIKEASKNGTLDHKEHPGLTRTTGHIGFLGHGDVVRFKNMRVKVL